MIVEGAGPRRRGVGGGLLEEMQDDEQEPLTGTFMDYLVPTAMELPPIETVHLEYPLPAHPGHQDRGRCHLAARQEDARPPCVSRARRGWTPCGG